MGFFRYASGTARVSLTSADPISVFRCIQTAGIPVYDMEKYTELEYRFRIRRTDVKALRKLLKKRGEQIRILPEKGLYWVLKALLKRPVLILGTVFLLVLSLWVPSRVFFVRVEGNVKLSAQQIIQQAQLCGIGFGAARREVRSEQMKNDLLSAIPQLQWAGVNTYGCVAVITVRERTEQQKESAPAGIASVVALREGIIRDMTVIRGSALCKPGQAVSAGQVLVSAYTDCGIYIQACRAEAEIFAQTQRRLSVVVPSEFVFRREKTDVRKNYSLIIGKNRINFAKDSGILGSTCAKIEMEYKLMLPGGFTLPVSLLVEQIISYDTVSATTDTAEDILSSFAKGYLQQQMIAGTVENAAELFTRLDGLWRMDGIYDCCEMIGKTCPEDFINGKND